MSPAMPDRTPPRRLTERPPAPVVPLRRPVRTIKRPKPAAELMEVGETFALTPTAVRHAIAERQAWGALAVYEFLAQSCRHDEDDPLLGQCWPSEETIAEDCNMGLRTVERYISVLREIGAVTVRSERADGSRHAHNVYTVAGQDKAGKWQGGAPVRGKRTKPTRGAMWVAARFDERVRETLPEWCALITSTPTNRKDLAKTVAAWQRERGYTDEHLAELIEAFLDLGRRPSQLKVDPSTVRPYQAFIWRIDQVARHHKVMASVRSGRDGASSAVVEL